MKPNVVLLLAFFLTIGGLIEARAGKNLCVFKVSSAPYVELTGDSDITSQVFDSNYFTVTAIGGEMFPLLGCQWTFDNVNRGLSILPNGRIYVGVDTAFAIFDCLYSDSLALIDNTSKVSYKIEGPSNEKILKMQWKNLKVVTGPANNYLNIQVWLYEETGVIEFRYGPRSLNNASGYTDPVTGIYIGIWYSTPDFSRMYEKIQVKGTPPNILIDSVLNLNVPNIQGVPESGTVYRFVPKSVVASVLPMTKDFSVTIYPNPAKTEIISEFDASIIPMTATLIDISGKAVRHITIPPGSSICRMQIEDVAPGSYELVLQSDERRFSSEVLVLR